MTNYQDFYPAKPLLSSDELNSSFASGLITVDYIKGGPKTIEPQVYNQHLVLININRSSYFLEYWINDNYHATNYKKDHIIIIPAGVKVGWHWHRRVEGLVVLLDKKEFEIFAQKELGLLLANNPLKEILNFEDLDITKAAEYLFEALESKAIGCEVIFESLARVFLVKLIQKYGQVISDSYVFKKGFSSKQYKKIFDFVKQHYGEPISLDDLARVAGISPSHFSRQFKKTVGLSPMSFLQSQRVEQAKICLADDNLLLVDIANHCGFSDQAHFSRLFKKYTDISPTAYRSLLRQNKTNF